MFNQTKLILLSFVLVISSCLPAQSGGSFEPTLNAIAKELEDGQRPSEKVLAALSSLIEKDAKNYQAHFLLGTCYDSLGLPDQALEQFELAAKYGPTNASAMLELIKHQTTLEHLDIGYKLVKAAAKQFPNNLEVTLWQADYSLRYLNKLQDAEQGFQKVLASGKKFPGLYLGLAEIRLKAARYPEAVHFAKLEIKNYPQNKLAQLILGKAYMSMGLYGRAYSPLQEAYNHFPFRQKVAWQYAQAAFWLGKYQDAIEPLMVELFLTSTPFDEDEATERLLVDSIQRVPKEAAQKIILATSKILDQKKLNPSFHRTLGYVLAQAGMHDLAIASLQTCLNANHEDGLAAFLLAKQMELYEHNYGEAMQYYQIARSLRPDSSVPNKYAVRLLDRLNKRNADLAWQLKDWLKAK